MAPNARRVAEWSAVAVVVLTLVGFFGREVAVVQGQAEAAMIKSRLGALRTALVIDQLAQSVGRVALLQRNPFLLLDPVPADYAGHRDPARPALLAPGSWVYDGVCRCIGYAPAHSQWLDNADADQTLWFRISEPPGPLQITPVARYVWRDEALE